MKSNEEDAGNSHVTNIKNDVQSIDKALSLIDQRIRRSGRTQLKSVQHIFSSITDKGSYIKFPLKDFFFKIQ